MSLGLVLENIFLARGGLKPSSIKHFLSTPSQKIFQQALTTKETNNYFNLETVEFKGDGMINIIATEYVENKYPTIKSIRWKTKLKHNISATNILAKICDKMGLSKYIVHGKTFDNETKEDVIEAFVGSIGKICGINNLGGYHAISYNIISSYYDEMEEINLNYIQQFDIATRVKELFDRFGWGDINTKVTVIDGKFMKRIIMPTINGSEILANVTARSKEAALSLAFEAALVSLKNKGIQEEIPDPFMHASFKTSKLAITLTSIPTIPKGFDIHINECFGTMLSKKALSHLINNVEFLYKSFIDGNEYLGINNLHDQYKGVAICDFIVIEYILNNSNVNTPHSLSILKHAISSSDIFVNFMDTNKLSQYILVLEETTVTPKIIVACFKALLGAVTTLLDSKFGHGSGITVLYPLITSYFKMNNVNLDPKNVEIHAKTQMATLGIKHHTKFVQNEDKTWVASVYVDGVLRGISNPEKFKDKAAKDATKNALHAIGMWRS